MKSLRRLKFNMLHFNLCRKMDGIGLKMNLPHPIIAYNCIVVKRQPAITIAGH